jgi:hypothetical protein
VQRHFVIPQTLIRHALNVPCVDIRCERKRTQGPVLLDSTARQTAKTALQGKRQKRNSKQAIVILADSKKEHVLQRCHLSTVSKAFTVSMNTHRKKSRMWTTDRD